MSEQASDGIEINRLILLEERNKSDVIVRMVGIPIGALIYLAYTGDPVSLLWAFAYVVLYLVHRAYLRSLRTEASAFQTDIVYASLALLTVVYLWLPSKMLVSPDLNLSLAGSALVAAQLVHLVHRGDTSQKLIVGLTVAFFGTTAAFLLPYLFQLNNPVAVIGIGLSWLALVFYLWQSMMSARRRILDEEAAKLTAFQAQKMAALGQLAGGVAHDFNNILTAIHGNLEIYKHLASEEEKHQVIVEAEQASLKAASTVRQMLLFARKAPQKAEVVDANEPMSAARVLTQRAVPANLSLEWVMLDGPAKIRVDADHIATALMNLVSNSIDACDGQGEISVSARLVKRPAQTGYVGVETPTNGPFVVYQVKDNGTGIPDQVLKRVTEPFFTTKDVGKGTGLGLSMVVSIVESFEGALRIESSTAGTLVEIYLPIERY